MTGKRKKDKLKQDKHQKHQKQAHEKKLKEKELGKIHGGVAGINAIQFPATSFISSTPC